MVADFCKTDVAHTQGSILLSFKRNLVLFYDGTARRCINGF